METATATIKSARLNAAAELLRWSIYENPYMRPALEQMGGKFPSAPQSAFLALPVREMLFGGAAGGGKSAGILAAGLQFVQLPGYDAAIFRRSFKDLEKPGGLIPLSVEWLADTDAEYDGQQHRWHFPSGATLSFGHAMNDKSIVTDYQGSAFSFFGFDELTQFTEYQYRYLFSRRRKRVNLPFPIRTRATSNPGGEGHDWVKKRFLPAKDEFGRWIVPDPHKRRFIPARLEDNPGLDREEYELSLAELDWITRRQLRHGDWNIRAEGNMFHRSWFPAVDYGPGRIIKSVRFWDLAATPLKPGQNPDFVAGCKMHEGNDGNFYVANMARFRDTPKVIQDRIVATAKADGRDVAIRIEQEPGASSKLYIENLANGALRGFDVMGRPSRRNKEVRARPTSSAAERGLIRLIGGAWTEVFLDEVCAFPSPGVKDDQVDAFTGAYNELADEPEEWEAADVASVLNYAYRF